MAKLKSKRELADDLRDNVIRLSQRTSCLPQERNYSVHKRDNLAAALVLIQKANDILKNK